MRVETIPAPAPRPVTQHRNIPATLHRRFAGGLDHRPPRSGLDDLGNRWAGSSRVRDRVARRRANRRTWAQEKAQARRDAIARRLAEAAA